MSTVLAGWYADPENPGQLRWWNGNEWTEHFHPRGPDSIEAGWYDDPNVPNARRFWDGATWTDHYEAPPDQAPAPPGWYPDAENPNVDRYWDGAAWTDQIQVRPIFDAELHVGFWTKKKKMRLVVSPIDMWWGDEHILWADVTAFNQLITVQHGFESMYQIDITRGEQVTKIFIQRKGHPDVAARHGYDAIIHQLRSSLGNRVFRSLMEMADRGEPVRVAGLLLSPEGFAHEEKGQEMQPWTEFAGMEVGGHEGIYVTLFRNVNGKKKKVTRVSVDQLRSWVLPPLIEEHARRYAGA
jgi:hypothetical protein